MRMKLKNMRRKRVIFDNLLFRYMCVLIYVEKKVIIKRKKELSELMAKE